MNRDSAEWNASRAVSTIHWWFRFSEILPLKLRPETHLESPTETTTLNTPINGTVIAQGFFGQFCGSIISLLYRTKYEASQKCCRRSEEFSTTKLRVLSFFFLTTDRTLKAVQDLRIWRYLKLWLHTNLLPDGCGKCSIKVSNRTQKSSFYWNLSIRTIHISISWNEIFLYPSSRHSCNFCPGGCRPSWSGYVSISPFLKDSTHWLPGL